MAGVESAAQPLPRAAMQITLNGQPREVPRGSTAAELVEALGLAGRRYAMEINGELAPKGEHAGRVLAPGDRIEIVQAVGGG
jgi:sulfur carrier protein